METVSCSICGRRLLGSPKEWPQYPFCSKRCKTIDLGRWLGGKYAIPAEEPADEEIDTEEDS